MYGDVELIAGEDFEMKYADNTGLGTATAFINGINGFNFSEQLAFTIRLGNTPKVTCTNVASGMKVSWIKVGGATRYKVYRNNKLIFTTSALVVTDKDVKYKGGSIE